LGVESQNFGTFSLCKNFRDRRELELRMENQNFEPLAYEKILEIVEDQNWE
jgi:hypothetical protein